MQPCRGPRQGPSSPGQLRACRGARCGAGQASLAPLALPAARLWLQERALAWPRSAWLRARSPQRPPRPSHRVRPSLPLLRFGTRAMLQVPPPAAVPVLVPRGAWGPCQEPRAALCAGRAPALPAAWSPARPEQLLPRSPSCSSESILRTQPGSHLPPRRWGAGCSPAVSMAQAPLCRCGAPLTPACCSPLPSRQRRCEP